MPQDDLQVGHLRLSGSDFTADAVDDFHARRFGWSLSVINEPPNLRKMSINAPLHGLERMRLEGCDDGAHRTRGGKPGGYLFRI